MTSIQLPASLPGVLSSPSPFSGSSDATSSPGSPSHSRRHSRNPHSASLPAFSFNPAVMSKSEDEGGQEGTAAEQDINLQAAARQTSKPPPLPDFKFNPGAEMQSTSTPSPTHPILEQMAINQKRVTRSARPAPLPAFTFSGGTTSHPTTPSPTKANFGDNTTSLRAGGHRRGGSEFVGGGAENVHLVSISPQKSDSRSHPPPVAPRGHAHRRSQAISISEIDTSELIKTSARGKFRSGSTPTTPSESIIQFSTHGSPQNHEPVSSRPQSPQNSPFRDMAPAVRPRVGFSDHVDVIPRPLSMISSETSGSSSTVRGYHSVSGSINSIAASPTPQPPSSTFFVEQESPSQRPQTADAATSPPPPANPSVGDILTIDLPKRPFSASGSPVANQAGSPSLKKKFWFSHSAGNSPSATPKSEQKDPLSTLPSFPSSMHTEIARPKTSPERTISKKKVKARTWTSGIFSRKSRPRHPKAKVKRTPTPPTMTRRTSDQMNEIFDSDGTIVIRNPSPVNHRPHLSTRVSSQPVSPSAKIQELLESSVASPVIDLDAALGPFGSEEKLAGDNSNRTAASRIAKLHSSERRGTTDAFGYHRRAESAPQMAPVSRTAFAIHRIGSSTSLVEDVFDEEEEDNFWAEEKEGSRLSEAGSENHRPLTANSETEVPKSYTGPLESETNKADGLGLSVANAAADSVFIVDAEAEIGLDPSRASNSTIEAPILTERELPKRPATSPLELAYPTPQTYYASSTDGRTATNSLISSPEADHISFEQQPRFNRSVGERSPDGGVRASNDDLPSLTDSISTGAVPRFSSSANTRSSVEQRSASVCDPVVPKSPHAWKRASLASLNRLIPGSSNGSRLKFETTPDVSDDEKARKKGNRISKLMHFWRSKEKAAK